MKVDDASARHREDFRQTISRETNGTCRANTIKGRHKQSEEGETIRINVKNKLSSGTGMLSAAGLAGSISSTGRQKASLAPPPASGRIRSPLPPPPNDTVTARISNTSSPISNTASKFSIDDTRHNVDPLDLSQLEVNLPSTTSSGSAKTNTASGWAAF